MSESLEPEGDSARTLREKARRIAHRRGRRFSADTRDEIAAEVLLRYYAKWGTRQRPDNVDAWLETTTKNLIIDLGRRGKKVRIDPLGDDTLEALRGTLPSCSARVVATAIQRAVLDLLPAEDRDLITERFFHGNTTAAVASMLGVTPAALDQRVARAKKRLRDALVLHPDLMEALRSEVSAPYSKHLDREL